MEINHHISGVQGKDDELLNIIIQAGIPFQRLPLYGSSSFAFVFDIFESDYHWPRIKKYMLEHENYLGIEETLFSEDELRNARWSLISHVPEKGYPMPDDHWPAIQSTLSLDCPICYTYRQDRPYRIRRESAWGKNCFLRLIWIQALFTKPEMIKNFKKQEFVGFEDWPVLIHKTSQVAETMRQIYVTATNPYEIVNKADLTPQICPECGRIRFAPQKHGTFQYKASEMASLTTDFLLTKEWVGNGLLSWQEILVSNRVVQYILDKKCENIRFKATELV
jgi:hypothetical protein